MSNDNINKNSQYPHIDQMTQDSRKIYLKDFEFKQKVDTMIAELNNLLSQNEESSDITKKLAEVQTVLQSLKGTVLSSLKNAASSYINLIVNDYDTDSLMRRVESTYETLFARLFSDIQTINSNVKNSTNSYDIIVSYLNKLKYSLYELIGKTSPYKDGRAEESDLSYVIKNINTNLHLRDLDIGIGFKTFPFTIDPSIPQGEYVKIFEFTPIVNETDHSELPYFLAELLIRGDLYFFKGRLLSTTSSIDGKRSAIFESDYTLNQDTPFCFKALYNETTNKIVVAFKFEETNDKLTSLVKLDFSVNLLVGRNLSFIKSNNIISKQ